MSKRIMFYRYTPVVTHMYKPSWSCRCCCPRLTPDRLSHDGWVSIQLQRHSCGTPSSTFELISLHSLSSETSQLSAATCLRYASKSKFLSSGSVITVQAVSPVLLIKTTSSLIVAFTYHHRSQSSIVEEESF
jgi:hypothetical protein